jgi:hypothetical protein
MDGRIYIQTVAADIFEGFLKIPMKPLLKFSDINEPFWQLKIFICF